MNPVERDIRGYFGIASEDSILEHYGTKRHSGRYPWGSGENPYQRSGDFLSRVEELKKSGMKEKDKEYKGSGSPTFYTTDDVLTDMLLLEDGIGHPLYADEAALARKLRVKEIVTVPRMEGRKGAKGGDLLGIVVNLADYTVSADKGGEVNMFDDFNIDYVGSGQCCVGRTEPLR